MVNRRRRRRGNQFDSLEPDLQTPRRVHYVGFEDNPWSLVCSQSGIVDSMRIGDMHVTGSMSGVSVDGYDDAVHQASSGEVTLIDNPPRAIINHNLGTAIVDVTTYDGVTSGIFIPDCVRPIDENNVEITLVEPQPMIVLIQRGKVV